MNSWCKRAIIVATRMSGALAVLAILSLGYAGFVFFTLPNVSELRDTPPIKTSYMRRVGSAEEAANVDWMPLEQFSPLLVCAVLKAEDRGFFRHSGFEWSQMRKAAQSFLAFKRAPGGSTITQQLARNLYLGPERTFYRKTREGAIAWQLERSISKRRILELYLNVIEWGGDIWGAKSASKYYFVKHPGELDAFESSFLAGLIAQPRASLTGRNLERAARVQSRVLSQLRLSGLLNEGEWALAEARRQALGAALKSGRPLHEALRDASSLQVPLALLLPRFEHSPLPLERALEDECGLARELAERKRIAGPPSSMTRIDGVPHPNSNEGI